MGCDIHMVLERKIKDEWVGVHHYHGFEAVTLRGPDIIKSDKKPNPYGWIKFKITDRDYRLFGELAGVRTDGTLGNQPQGLPEDASQLTRALADEWGMDGHSHSHLSLTEFAQAYAAAMDQTAQLVEHRLHPTEQTQTWFNDICTLITGFDVYDNKHYDFRICFWFDN